MEWILRPWHLTVIAVAGIMNAEQTKAIAYLQTENAVLREKLGKKRILLDNDQRRRLAVKGKELGRKRLLEISALFTPDTILRWHRQLVARKWDYSANRGVTGPPRIRQEIVDTILRMAKENRTWGYDRIQGALRNVGYHVSDATVANVLKRDGIEPVPRRGAYTTWNTLLQTHWAVLSAMDFTTVEVWTRSGLQTYYILVAMHLSSRRAQICGITKNPNAAWM